MLLRMRCGGKSASSPTTQRTRPSRVRMYLLIECINVLSHPQMSGGIEVRKPIATFPSLPLSLNSTPKRSNSATKYSTLTSTGYESRPAVILYRVEMPGVVFRALFGLPVNALSHVQYRHTSMGTDSRTFDDASHDKTRFAFDDLA